MTVTAVLDACVLYPFHLRDLLVRLAAAGTYEARWSRAISAEWMRAVGRERPELAHRLSRTNDLMNIALPRALTTDVDQPVVPVRLPDPDDHHVVDAALRCKADAIVTFNLRDFPEAELGRFGLVAFHPDTFIVERFRVAPIAATSAVQAILRTLKHPALTRGQLAARYAAAGLPRTAALVAAPATRT